MTVNSVSRLAMPEWCWAGSSEWTQFELEKNVKSPSNYALETPVNITISGNRLSRPEETILLGDTNKDTET